MPKLIFLYILVCIVVGFCGINRKFGFWGYFFASLAFTPFIGLIMVLGSSKRDLKRREDD